MGRCPLSDQFPCPGTKAQAGMGKSSPPHTRQTVVPGQRHSAPDTDDADLLADAVRRATRLLLDLDRFAERLRSEGAAPTRVAALDSRIYAVRRLVVILTEPLARRR
jgi:hypothetical protein